MKTFKKSLSLIMAVLMVLSCWVWVAPTEAEAASYTNYKVVITYGVYEKPNGGGHVEFDFGNGYEVVIGSTNMNNGSDTVTVDKWPQKIKITHKTRASSGGKADIDINKVTINGRTVMSGIIEIPQRSGYWGLSEAVDSAEFGPTNDAGTAYSISAKTYRDVTFDWPKPAPVRVEGKPSEDKVSVEVPRLDITDDKDLPVFSSNINLSFYDQYDVKYDGNVELGLKTLNNKDADIDQSFTKEDKGLWYANGNVWYNKYAQELMPLATGTSYYLFYHYKDDTLGEKRELLSTITLNYPEYTVSVNQQADVKAFNALMSMSDGRAQIDTWSFTGVYQESAIVWPTGVASKDGYEFKGFWTKPQPTGDAGYYAFESAFATPVSSEDFVERFGGKKSDDVNYDPYITNGGKTYYDAGTRWDATKHKEVLGDITYYGWWNAKDISVKFYDIDGTYLGTQTTKYGKIEEKGWYPDPQDGYTAGAYEYQGFAGQWRDITGAVITEGSYAFNTLPSLTLTPIYTTKTYQDKYTVNFMSAYGGIEGGANQDDGIGSGRYAYRHILSGANIPQLTVPTGLDDAEKSHRFSGWSTQKPASGKYHVVAEGDESFVENTDWVVREDITYYPVYRYTIKKYAVSFTYFDATGTEKTDIKYIPYGSIISTPDNINRKYAIDGYGRDLESWTYLNSSYYDAELGVDDNIVLNKDNFALQASNLSDDDPVLFSSNYSDPKPTPYTITFKYKGENGEDKAITAEVYHGSKISAETVADLAVVPAQYDDGEALYTFADRWNVIEGTADKEVYLADEFTSFGPTSYVTFEAVYGEGVPFYTVTYHDGAKTYDERILRGGNVPAWMVQNGFNEDGTPIMEPYKPADIPSATGTYKFVGWFDAEQTDKTYTVTNGTEYTTASTVEGDLDLYAQFVFEPSKFAIKFVNYDGSVLAEGEYEADADFKAIYDEASNKAAKPADATYSYTFIGWDYVVPDTFKCEGKDMTYTAQYKPSYIYYKARWYQDKEAMDKADLPEWETVGQGGLLAITSYTYEGAVYAPSVDIVVPEGKVFVGWKYLKDGVETDYVRGMTITNDMSFYATFDNAAVVYTVTTVVNGKSTDYKVTAGKTAEVVGRPLDGYYDEQYHNEFKGWYTTDDYAVGTEFALDTKINSNTTIYAKFNLDEHNRDQKEIVTAPTYYAEGVEKAWCACSKSTAVETKIPMLTDKVAPTGTIYLGTQGKWSSTDEVFAKDDTNKYYANAKTDIILTINDTAGCENAGEEGHVCTDCTFNPAGTGIGIKMIRAFVSSDTFTAEQAQDAASLAITVFSDNSQTLNNTANYTVKVNAFTGGVELVSGQEYIVYYYAIDKANNVLNSNVRTAKFIYDDVAPVFTITGDSNAATATSTVTYCAEATVTGIEDGATVKVNGKEVTATEGKYVINQAGNYIITVTDKAGNSTSKKIIVAADHDKITTEVSATCTANGSKYVSCAVCKKVLTNETIPSSGHNYSPEKTVEATCEDQGYKIKTCSVCGDEVKSDYQDAKGHQQLKDSEGKVIYEVVTPATCKTVGRKISNCTVCGYIVEDVEIDVDTENGHRYGAKKILKATCTANGEEYQTCKYCFEKKTIRELPALNHVDTGRYTKVTTAATCKNAGEEKTYCKACNAVMGTNTIPATGKHIWFASTDPTKTFDATADKEGQITYECQTCDETKVEKIAKVEKYTVTFYGENGTTKLFEISEVVKGTTITKDYKWTVKENEADVEKTIVEPEKEDDNEYNYTFAGWADPSGKAVRFPFDVTGNVSLKATFTATKRTYTHIFKVNAEDETAFATILGAYKDEYKKPLTEPKKAATDINTYEFDGWKDVAGKDVEDFTMTGDKTFVAKFKAVPVKYSVIFYDADRTTVLYNVKVDGGAEVTYVGDEPTKEENATYHYTFAGWEYGSSTLGLDAKITNITETTRLYAKYTEAKHTFETVVGADKTWAATCTTAGQKTEKCDCGYVKVTEEAALGHDYSIVLEDGSKKCSRCEDTIAPEAKMVTITFVNDEGKVLKTVEVEEGKTYTFTAPAKDSTVAADFTFFNWVDESGAKVCDAAEITVTAGTANATYKAVYTANARSYNVVFVNADGKQLYFVSVAYGSAMPTYKGATPEKAYDANNHYVWANSWKLVAGESATEVKGNTRLMAEYTAEAHSFVETETAATCQQTGGLKKVCSCGLAHTIGDEIPKIDHKIGEVVSYKAPQLGVAGSRTYICSMCKQEFTESIPALAAADISIQVYNYDGVLAKSATVELWYTVDGELVQYVANATGDYLTDANGAVSVTVPAEYKGWRAKVYLLEGGSYNEEIKTGTLNVIGAPKAEEPEDTNKDDCSCSCHKNTFWGFIFRLFQKIVKLFAGKAKCCSNPDSRI